MKIDEKAALIQVPYTYCFHYTVKNSSVDKKLGSRTTISPECCAEQHIVELDYKFSTTSVMYSDK